MVRRAVCRETLCRGGWCARATSTCGGGGTEAVPTRGGHSSAGTTIGSPNVASCGLVAVGERFTLERVTVPRGGQVASFAILSPPLLLPGGTAASGPLSHAGGPKKSPALTGPSAPPIDSHFDDQLLCGRDAKSALESGPLAPYTVMLEGQRIAMSTGMAGKKKRKRRNSGRD